MREIPEPEGSDAKEVFTFYGLAAYCGQVLEKGLVNLMVALHADGVAFTRSQFDRVFDSFDQKTFGQLLKNARTRISIPEAIEQLLIEALMKRNRLAYDFFLLMLRRSIPTMVVSR